MDEIVIEKRGRGRPKKSEAAKKEVKSKNNAKAYMRVREAVDYYRIQTQTDSIDLKEK
jgi:hypothetical protein